MNTKNLKQICNNMKINKIKKPSIFSIDGKNTHTIYTMTEALTTKATPK